MQARDALNRKKMDDGRHEAVEEPRRIKIRLVILSVDVSPILTCDTLWSNILVVRLTTISSTSQQRVSL
jgi:ribosomal protein L7Ae-like RNA K-turn-binding protein